MKKNILLLFVYCYFAKGFSQEISINLSYEWRNEELTFLDSTFNVIPYLNITYKNELNVPVYFSRVSSKKKGIPEIYSDWVFYNKKNPVNFNSYNYSEEKYNVFIDNYISITSDLNTFWEVLSDTISPDEERENDIINFTLSEIYLWYDKPDNELIHNSDTLFIDECLRIPDYKEKFVFLHPGESVTDSYNLFGFSILKGEYTFQFECNQRSPIIHIDSYSVISKYFCKEKELPTKIEEYSLYKGEFSSNKVKIKFD